MEERIEVHRVGMKEEWGMEERDERKGGMEEKNEWETGMEERMKEMDEGEG